MFAHRLCEVDLVAFSCCACIQAYQPKNLYNAVFHGVLDQQSGTQAGAYQTTNFSYAVFHGVLDQQSGTQAGTYHNEFQQCCLPWSLGPAERHTGRGVSQRISAMLSPMESWTSRAAHRQGRITTNFSNTVSHGVLDQQSGTQAGAYHNEFQQCSLPWSHGPAERHTGRGVSQRISAMLSPMESWTSRAAHRQGRITTNFSYAVFHGVLDQQSGTQAGTYHNEFQLRCLPWSLGPAERHTGRGVTQRISATLSPMESWTSRAAHRQGRITTNFSYAVFHGVLDQQSGTQAGRITTNFSYAVFHGVLDQQSGTQAGTYHNEFQQLSPWSLDQQSGTQAETYHKRISATLSPMESWTSRAAHRQGRIKQRISATLSSMESWTSRAAHRQGRITTNFSYAVFHGVLDQQSGTQAGTYHNEFQPCCLPWSLGPAERHTGRSVSQRISATLSSMESWTSRAAHRQGRITTNFSYAVFHGVLDQQSGTQAGTYHNEFQLRCLPWSLGPAERHTGV
ncbi:hypothetical protein J6590_088138 [Homalodisca vitripennis]|nr:hypothetical protein J6590_088138 [Homalodisca vitripennis]